MTRIEVHLPDHLSATDVARILIDVMREDERIRDRKRFRKEHVKDPRDPRHSSVWGV